MNPLTVRGVDAELVKRLRELAERDRSSLNEAALKLMRRGAGLEAAPSPNPPIGDRLARFSARMTADDAQAIDNAIRNSRKQDKDLQG